MRRWIMGIAVLAAILSGGTASAVAGPLGNDAGRNRSVPPVTAEAPEPATEDGTPDGSAPLAGDAAAQAAPPPGAAPSGSAQAGSAQAGSAQPGSAQPGSARPAGAAQAGPPCPVGERLREVEGYLAEIGAYGAMSVDGVPTAAECTAVINFQKRFGISPANGRAGPTTASVARRIAASRTAAERAKCTPAGTGLTACVDLTQQTVWLARPDGSLAWGPTVIRSGMPGYATPAGRYRVFGRNIKEWSVPYKVWMPYWQAFNGGIGFHETVSYLHNTGGGSHGCVNLLRSDATELWNLIGKGTTVHTFGRRPGT